MSPRYKEAREDIGLSTTQVACILEVEHATIERIETGRLSPKPAEMLRLSRLYQRSPNYLRGDPTIPAATGESAGAAYVADAAPFPNYPHQPGMKYTHALGFEGGSLSIHARGYGDRDGSGYFAFNEDDLEWDHDDDGKATRFVRVDRSELIALRDKLIEAFPPAETFQARTREHIDHVAGDDATDLAERRDRHAEEDAELLQALGLTREGHHRIVDYVHDRPVGEPAQEMGGTLHTLAALASYADLDMMACGEAELARCWTPEVVAKIRRKRARRHGRGVLPGDDADLVTASVELPGADGGDG